jgi:hypothetical protein
MKDKGKKKLTAREREIAIRIRTRAEFFGNPKKAANASPPPKLPAKAKVEVSGMIAFEVIPPSIL